MKDDEKIRIVGLAEYLPAADPDRWFNDFLDFLQQRASEVRNELGYCYRCHQASGNLAQCPYCITHQFYTWYSGERGATILAAYKLGGHDAVRGILEPDLG